MFNLPVCKCSSKITRLNEVSTGLQVRDSVLIGLTGATLR